MAGSVAVTEMATAGEAAPERRLALLVRSDAFEDVLLALTLAGIAAGAGLAVTLFFTGRAARLLRAGALAEFDPPGDGVAAQLRDGAESLGMGDLEALMRRAKGLGRVRIFLCSRGARSFDLGPADLYPEVDSVVGTAAFLLNDLAAADISLTI